MEREKILIVKPSSLGDVVHTLPAVAAVHAAHPQADITWLINSEWAPLLRGNPHIDHVHIFPRAQFRGLGAPMRFFPWLRRLRQLRPDVALDFQGLLRSAMMAKVSRAGTILGLSDAREGSRFFYKSTAHVDARTHAVDRYLALAELCGAPRPERLQFRLPTGDQPPRFEPFPAFVVLHPHARGRGKSLGRSAVLEFCRALAPLRVVIVGRARHRFSPPENCIELTNQTTLLQLVWLIRHAGYVVSVDSGPMHIAAALSSNLVSIHTWSDPRRVGPYNPAALVWKNGALLRVADLNDAAGVRKGRKFRARDVNQIAEEVLRALNDCVAANAF